MTDVTLPPLAEGVDKAGVSYWHHAAGESVKEGEDKIAAEGKTIPAQKAAVWNPFP